MNPFVNIIKKEFWGRVLISAIIVLSFLAVLIGIEHAMLGNHQLDKDWKEVLMLLLGALIGGFSKVIDFWFKDHTNDTYSIAFHASFLLKPLFYGWRDVL